MYWENCQSGIILNGISPRLGYWQNPLNNTETLIASFNLYID